MDRIIDPKENRGKRNRKVGYWLLVALALGAGAYLLTRWIRPAADEDRLRFATVERGDVQNTVNATALVLPAFEEQLNAPVATQIEEVLLTAGKKVGEGDLLMRLDQDYVRLQLDGRRDQLAIRENNIDLLNLEYDRDLQQLTYDAEIKKLELAAAQTQLEDARRLLEIGGATEEEVEAADLRVRIIRLESQKLDNQLTYSRNSLAGRKRRLQLEVGVEEKEVSQLSQRLRETDVRAPRAGVVTWINENIGQQVAEGTPLARIANLGRYRVEGSLSDRYAEQLSVGMPVEMHVGRERLTGTVTAILPEVNNNTIRFRVALDEADSEGLRPNLRAELYLITNNRENVLRVKNGPTFGGGRTQSVFVVRGGEAVRTEVQTGLRNGDFVEIVGGLRPGDKIIISDTEEFDRMSTLQLTE